MLIKKVIITYILILLTVKITAWLGIEPLYAIHEYQPKCVHTENFLIVFWQSSLISSDEISGLIYFVNKKQTFYGKLSTFS